MREPHKLTKQDVNEYPYIFAWGVYLKSHEHFIAYRIHLAREANAPNGACSPKDPDHKEWRTIDDLTPRQQEAVNDIIAHTLAQEV